MYTRSAGILLHVTSLPSRFGIGDIGPEARKFADFLQRAKQNYWQILPLNPVEKGQGYSPYSSTSSMAGNTLLISPEMLRKEKLLTDADLKSANVTNSGKVNFEKAVMFKSNLLDKACQKFFSSGRSTNDYDQFCKKEKRWLDDFALYSVLKTNFNGQPWYEWPDQFRNRVPRALKKFERENANPIQAVKWGQYKFFEQWNLLRTYCNERSVKLFGDLPFYVSYDSADVWADPEIFSLDKNKNIQGVAGVPPDYFNADGQLWGMPVFRWNVLKKRNFDWWVRRLQKNIEMFDVVRLDHFRAFADYWEVASSEKTAKNGQWKQGPGASIFRQIKKSIGSLPFVAEDLGDINDAVYKLRDEFQFPGMKVLQFAFGDNTGVSDYIPHNYTQNFIAYTGTHDNNTTRGWYRKDISSKDKIHVNKYLGRTITEKNIHEELARLAYSSVANVVIVPMQDVLGLDETARINTPASISGNWAWRLTQKQMNTSNIESRLREWALYYRRGI